MATEMNNELESNAYDALFRRNRLLGERDELGTMMLMVDGVVVIGMVTGAAGLILKKVFESRSQGKWTDKLAIGVSTLMFGAGAVAGSLGAAGHVFLETPLVDVLIDIDSQTQTIEKYAQVNPEFASNVLGRKT